MTWNDVEQLVNQLAGQGFFSGAEWISRSDGIREDKEKDCAIFKIHHKTGTSTMWLEYGLLGSGRVFCVKSDLEKKGISGTIVERGNTVATINGTRFRIGYGSTMPYLVFKPLGYKNLVIGDLNKATFRERLQEFRDSVINSGLPELLAKI